MSYIFYSLLVAFVISLPIQLIGTAFIFYFDKPRLTKSYRFVVNFLAGLSVFIVLAATTYFCWQEPQYIGVLILGGFVLVITTAIGSGGLTWLYLNNLAQWRISGVAVLIRKIVIAETILLAMIGSYYGNDLLMKRAIRLSESGQKGMNFPGQQIMPLRSTELVQLLRVAKDKIEVSLESGVKRCFEFRKNPRSQWPEITCDDGIMNSSEMVSPSQTANFKNFEIYDSENLKVVESYVRQNDAILIVEDKDLNGKLRLLSYLIASDGKPRLESSEIDISLPNDKGGYGGFFAKTAGISDGIDKRCFKAALENRHLVLSTCEGIYVAYVHSWIK